MSAVDDAVAEIDAQLATLSPQHEGLKDYQRLNLQPDTLTSVGQALAVYDRRVSLLTRGRDALTALQADGHPAFDVQQVTAAVYGDLAANQATIAAALAIFASDPAATLGLSASTPEAK
jgi:hypothetical protein